MTIVPPSHTAHAPQQPLLSDAAIAFRAPTQVLSNHDGTIGGSPIDGVYHGDVRHVRRLELWCAGSPVEWISTSAEAADRVLFGGLLRGLDDASPDPKVRILRERKVSAGRVTETVTIASHLTEPVRTTLSVSIEPDFSLLHEVKSGLSVSRAHDIEVSAGRAVIAAGRQGFLLDVDEASVVVDEGAIVASWNVSVPARGATTVTWELQLRDDALVVQAAESSPPWDAAALTRGFATTAPRLANWLERALGDLDALRLARADHPEDEFFAAGAPWFFTLFGRDSLWAARLTLSLDVGIAASTLRALARLQGTVDDPDSAQEPGKILHELRSTTLELPGEGISLPPQYYGSVDSTPLWVCLLVDAWRAGMSDSEVRTLLPHLVAALGWIVEHGDSDGDGFLDYVDRTGRGLANQGWKDSGDSIQWRDGRLAEGPIALCEVQAYAYEAVLGGAELLEAFSSDTAALAGAYHPAVLRSWAGELRRRFAESFWVETPEGRYPAVALDRDKRPVDTLTSNIGHLLGTGIIDPDEEAQIAALLVGPSMSSGFGVRTMSTDAAGYWPLSYHGGSVWTHDSAICARGMALAGLTEHAQRLAEELLSAAEGFAYRVPELHSGDAASTSAAPTPYPAACRPQAWSAAAAVTCLEILRGSRHD